MIIQIRKSSENYFFVTLDRDCRRYGKLYIRREILFYFHRLTVEIQWQTEAYLISFSNFRAKNVKRDFESLKPISILCIDDDAQRPGEVDGVISSVLVKSFG